MPSKTKSNLIVPLSLIAISFIPLLAGLLRLIQLSGGPISLPDSERVLTLPALPLILHIAGAMIFTIGGAFQFSVTLREKWPAWHIWAGRVVVFFGLVVALTAIWSNQFFPPSATDGQVIYVARIVVGIAMIFCFLLGFLNIRRQNIRAHRTWMMRGFALGIGPGTQAILAILWTISVGEMDASAKAFLFPAGWLINLAVVECLLLRRGKL